MDFAFINIYIFTWDRNQFNIFMVDGRLEVFQIDTSDYLRPVVASNPQQQKQQQQHQQQQRKQLLAILSHQNSHGLKRDGGKK